MADYGDYLWSVTDQDKRNRNATGRLEGQFATFNPTTQSWDWTAMNPEMAGIYDAYDASIQEANSAPKSAAELQGMGGGQGSSGAQGSTYAGPGEGYNKPPEVNPITTPTTSSAFAPKGKVDYTGQNKLESSLKSALRNNTPRNIENTFHMAPKVTQKGSFLGAFK